MQIDIHVQRFLKTLVTHFVKHCVKVLFNTMLRNDELLRAILLLRALYSASSANALNVLFQIGGRPTQQLAGDQPI
jgi:hypothetical protein